MITVLIAEDDLLTRVGIGTMLKNQNSDVYVVGEASNGEEALAIARSTRPDFLLTDIQMPVMNGLELIKTVQAERLCRHVIILSAYNDFDYVREAMRLGADDYLLKLDIEPDTLIQKLEGIYRSDDSKFSLHGNEPDYRMLEFERNRCIHKLLTGNYTSKSALYERMKKAGIMLEDNHLLCVIISLTDGQRTAPDSSEDAARILRMLTDFSRSYGQVYGCSMNERLYCLLFSSVKTITRISGDTQSVICGEITEYAKNALSLTTTVIAGKPDASFEDISSFFSSCCTFHNGEYIIKTDAAPEADSALYSEEMYNIETALHSDDPMRIAKAFQDLKQRLRAEAAQNTKTFHSVCYMLIFFAEQYMKSEKHGKTTWRKSTATLSLNRSCFGKEDYLSFIDGICRSITDYIASDEDTHSAIMRARKYIQNNYARDISLDDAAKIAGLNPSYFSRLFSQEVGTSFVNYLKNIRINAAKKLLLETDARIQEVGEQVGYPNRYYFCRVFKQETGKTPGEYRLL